MKRGPKTHSSRRAFLVEGGIRRGDDDVAAVMGLPT